MGNHIGTVVQRILEVQKHLHDGNDEGRIPQLLENVNQQSAEECAQRISNSIQ